MSHGFTMVKPHDHPEDDVTSAELRLHLWCRSACHAAHGRCSAELLPLQAVADAVEAPCRAFGGSVWVMTCYDKRLGLKANHLGFLETQS